MNTLARHRRHPAAIFVFIVLGLIVMGFAYEVAAPKKAGASVANAAQIEEGRDLFLANCATCHGINGEGRVTGNDDKVAGPSLAGVGAAAVDFQMGTGRMPMRAPSVQAPRDESNVRFSQEQIDAVGAYIASLAPGPAVPSDEQVDPRKGDAAAGGELFRVNCAMCHNFAGSGGALTRGKYAPSLMDIKPKHIYEAMETGPQSMPVFSDTNLNAKEKRDVIAYLKALEEQPKPGGQSLGALGPSSEGWFIWIFGLGLMIAAAVWLGQKSA